MQKITKSDILQIIKKQPIVNLYLLENEETFFCGIPLDIKDNWLFLQSLTCYGENDGILMIHLKYIHQIEFADKYSKSVLKLWNIKKQRVPKDNAYCKFKLKEKIGEICEIYLIGSDEFYGKIIDINEHTITVQKEMGELYAIEFKNICYICFDTDDLKWYKESKENEYQ